VRGHRCEATFSNYLGYARVGCLLVGAPDAVFNKGALRRAKLAITKRELWKPRVKHFVQLPLVREMVIALVAAPSWRVTVMWVLTAYIFLLRRGVFSLCRVGPAWLRIRCSQGSLRVPPNCCRGRGVLRGAEGRAGGAVARCGLHHPAVAAEEKHASGKQAWAPLGPCVCGHGHGASVYMQAGADVLV